jgi:hypothetical protein
VKITKRQLRRIIKEEKKKILLKEFGSMDKEVLSPLIQFAQAWSGLGDAIQSQMIDVINGHIENREEAVYEINPNALDRAVERLSQPLDAMRGDTEAEEIMGALDWAVEIIHQGEDEVEADARAAGDR